METPATPPRRSARAVARVPPSPRFSAYDDMHPFTRDSPSSSVSPQQPAQPKLQNGDDDNSKLTIRIIPAPHLLTVPLGSAASSSSHLPTPSETPALTPSLKRQRAAGMKDSARILHFNDSNLDIGPTKKQKEVPIYVDPSARVPQKDTSSDNNMYYEPTPPRVTRGRPPIANSQEERLAQWNDSPSPPRRQKTTSQILEDERLQDAVDRGEGVFYML